MKAEEFIGKLKFDERALIVAIAQDVNTGAVLMQAYMDEESIRTTLETGYATYFSRSRQRLWVKGETSGNTQRVKEIYIDCDGDSLLLKVEQTGVACHTGSYSCFSTPVLGNDTVSGRGASVLQEEFDVILRRKENPKEGSYTNYLFDKGIDKICKKVGEESAEVIIAAKNRSREEVRYEVADLFYHVMVLLAEQGMTPDEVFAEMERRRKGD
ncbi:MAG: bifunctional phosphoribosyl-AMP cyclohydrolase/phosphoribosyl-ATP diphosphatase HisIE [Bacillota bacterium]